MNPRHFLSFLILFTAMASTAQAAEWYYLVDRDGRVIGRQDTPYTHVTSLESRGEKQIPSNKNIPLADAVYSSGKIAVREKTADELTIEESAAELRQEEALIRRRTRKIAMDSLRAEGHTFKRASE